MLGGVTDTHGLVWFTTGQVNRIGARARRVFVAADRKDGSGLVTVPRTVLHEISCLLITEKIKFRQNFADWVSALTKHGFFQIVDVTAEMVVNSHSFQAVKDPFDRLIMGCAAQMEQPLLTGDHQIIEVNAVEVIWD